MTVLYGFLIFAGILVGGWSLVEWICDGTHKLTVVISILALIAGTAGIASQIVDQKNLCESRGGVMIKDVCVKAEVIDL